MPFYNVIIWVVVIKTLKENALNILQSIFGQQNIKRKSKKIYLSTTGQQGVLQEQLYAYNIFSTFCVKFQ